MKVDNQVLELEGILAMFPSEYKPIDSDFKEKYKEAIELLKKKFDGKGGIYLSKIDDITILYRLLSEDEFKEVKKRSEKLGVLDGDKLIFGKCLLYPKWDVVQNWINSGMYGISVAISQDILDKSKIFYKVESEKL